MPRFHMGNALVHIAPLFFVPPGKPSLLRGIAAIAFHASWGYAASDGTMRLDRVYVPMEQWGLLWLVAFWAEMTSAMWPPFGPT